MGRVRRLADLAGVLARASSGQILSFDDSGDIQSTPSSSGTTVYADMAALIAATGMSSGDQAFVTGNNNLYIYSGTGWYKIATVQNDSPSTITGVAGSYSLATDGTPTVITAVSTDPEGFPLTWTYSTSGLGSIATISQADNVFTITPSTTEADAGTFSLTINATDGVNGAVSTSTNLTLEFIVTIANSRYTTLLATATGTGDNNDITDSSTNNHPITVYGDAHAGTFSPYRHGGYSTRVIGNDRLEASGFTISGSWTFEFWYKLPTGVSLDNYQTIASFGQSWGTNCRLFRMMQDPSTKFAFDFSGGGAAQNIYTHTETYNQDQWYHICATYDATANTGKVYIDGTEVYSASFTANWTGVTTAMIGQHRFDSSTLSGTPSGKGIFRDFHVIGNAAVAPAAGGSSKVELQSGSVLLLFSGGPLIDTSTSNCTISVGSNINNFYTLVDTPYDNLEYSAADHGRSIYFDGSGDKLSLPLSADTNIVKNNDDFTIEAWVYPTSFTGAAQTIVSQWGQVSTTTDGWILATNTSGQLGWYYGPYSTSAVAITGTSNPLCLNSWNHVAIVRTSGSHIMYVNGSQAGTYSGNSFYTGSYSYDTHIGFYGNGTTGGSPTSWWNGYISDLRFVKGSAVYTSNFTLPTAPLTAITNTSFLISGTNASIIDKSQRTNLKLVGNTTGSTNQVKFADTKSMYFDGNGDRITVNHDALGTGDWTIEGWVYFNSTATGTYVFDFRASANTNPALDIQTDWRYITDGAYRISSGVVPSAYTWYHFAIVKNNGTTTLYVNGSSIGTYADSLNYVGNSAGSIGKYHGGNSGFLNGYLQDFRITKGLARYTANFTPPTAPLEG